MVLFKNSIWNDTHIMDINEFVELLDQFLYWFNTTRDNSGNARNALFLFSANRKTLVMKDNARNRQKLNTIKMVNIQTKEIHNLVNLQRKPEYCSLCEKRHL